MALKIHTFYKGRTRELYSKDGDKWYEDREKTIPVDEDKLNGGSLSPLTLFLAMVFISLLSALLVRGCPYENKSLESPPVPVILENP